MIVKLLTERHLEFLSLKGGCTGSSESTLVKMQIVGNHVHWLIYELLVPIFHNCELLVPIFHICEITYRFFTCVKLCTNSSHM